MFLNCVNGADVGMVERRRSPRLAAETSLKLAVLGQFFGQELERHAAAELGVLGPVHHAPAPTAQLLQDAVVGNDLADHARNQPLSAILARLCLMTLRHTVQKSL